VEKTWTRRQPPCVNSVLKRQRMRLASYDYSRAGAYFVTVCVRDRKCLFGAIEAEEMCSTRIGQTVASCWLEIPKHFPNAALDEFVIMPNHLHGIILLNDVVAGHARPLPVIIGSLKTAVSRQAGVSVWQRSYWERIIRSEAELNQARRYIEENPARWPADKENPANAHAEPCPATPRGTNLIWPRSR